MSLIRIIDISNLMSFIASCN